MERMAKKDAVRADHGKKKMLRHSRPEHQKYVETSKKVKIDLDMLKYFGDEVDFSKIPEETDKERREREEAEQ